MRRRSGNTGKALSDPAEILKDIIFPRRCPVCDKPVSPFGELVCDGCRDKPVRAENGAVRWNGHLFEAAAAVFTYSSVKASIYRFKYGGRAEYADYFSLEMSLKLTEAYRPFQAGLIVPVPLDPERERARGYNQSALLAEGICRRTGLEYGKDALIRVRSTVPMKSVTGPERRINLKNAFIASSNDVKFKMIMLIDDIFTTGATADACALALLDAGAAGVNVLTLAVGEDT